jgi:hypothetical protein
MLAPQTQYAPAPEAARLAPPPAQVHPLEEIMQRCFVVAGRALWNAHHELDAAGDDGGGGVDGRADQREQRRLDFFQLLADLHRGRLLGCRAAEPDREARLE